LFFKLGAASKISNILTSKLKDTHPIKSLKKQKMNKYECFKDIL